jgi:hypothetical protein
MTELPLRSARTAVGEGVDKMGEKSSKGQRLVASVI